MKNIKKTLVVLILCSFIMGTIPVSAVTPEDNDLFQKPENKIQGEYVLGEIIVKFTPGTSDKARSDFKSKYNVRSMEKLLKTDQSVNEKSIMNPFIKHGLDRLYLMRMSENVDVIKIVQAFNKNPNVEYAEPNYIVHIDTIPNDLSSSLWGLHNTGQTGGTPDADIDAPEAWDIQTGSTGVVIAVIDTGVDYNHEDLAANIWTNPGETPDNGVDDDGNSFIDDIYGWDFINNDNDPFDDHDHGTHCAGTIAAVGNNANGIVGVNWNAKILPLKFLSANGSGSLADAVLSINYATSMEVDIMSNSWGGGGYYQSLYDAIATANDAGILFVAAAGNDNSNNDITSHYPSNYNLSNVIAVAATDHNDARAIFSNYGAESVDLGAPGVGIYSTIPGNSYATFSGTSMATPHVAGTVALIKAQHPTLTSDGIKERLLRSVDPVPSLDGITVTGGRLNAYNSVEEDGVAPSAVTDLAAGNPTFNSVTLTWTATGDDGTNGTANSYDVRYSTSIITDKNWDTAIKASREPIPQSAGSTEIFTVSGLSDSTSYYFAIKVLDNVGNPSELSNVVSETSTTLTIVFQDDMESGINEWNNESLWHKETYRSSSPITSWAYNTGNPNYNYDIGDNKGNLTSPVIDLSDYNTAILTFQYLYQTEDSGASWDQRWLQVGVDGVFTDVAQLSEDPMLVWNEYSLDISSYAGKSNVQVRFFFDTIDGVYNNYEGWYIDDIAVLGELGGANNPPVAVDDTDATSEDSLVITTVLSNDSDPDGDTLTVTSVTDPANGVAEINSGTTVTYTPNANFNGADSYVYTISDGNGGTDTATVTITVSAVNDAPVASDDAYDVDEDAFISVTTPGVLGNDTDSEGDPLTANLASGVSNGALALNTDGSFTYTPNAGFVGTDSFRYTANDGIADSNIATVTITVTEISTFPTMHIASIEMSTTEIKLNGWYTYATATVTVVNATGSPVENAKVFGTWSGATIGTNSDNTSYDGMVSFSSDKVKNAKSGTEFIFTVDDITLDGWTYDPSANIETSNST